MVTARSTKRNSGGSCAKRKMHRVMSEYSSRSLKSSSGKTVTSRAQAIAIGLSESRRHCGKTPVPRPKGKSKHHKGK